MSSLIGFLTSFLLLGLLFKDTPFVGAQQDWKTARATWYDDRPGMSVHSGSCLFGYLGDNFGGQGNWHVAAINDGNPSFQGSCGTCFEVRCNPADVKDSFGEVLSRRDSCASRDPIKVIITDNCPCTKPENAHSNKRWCCGDMDHLDMGVWAFRKLADPGIGVIGVQYRPVPCGEMAASASQMLRSRNAALGQSSAAKDDSKPTVPPAQESDTGKAGEHKAAKSDQRARRMGQ
jgi:hypothetical protein